MRFNINRFRQILRPRGSAVLDAALVFPILLSLTFGTIEYGYYFYVKHSLQGAAREGARAAITPSATNSDVTTAVTTRFGGQVADGFTAFAVAAASSGGDSCTAGLLLKNPADSSGQTCDIHPSTAGAQLLAATLAAAVGAPSSQAAGAA